MGTWKSETKAQLKLAAPVVVIQVGLMLMGIVDTIFMGFLSPTQFAGVGLGDAMSFAVIAFGMGTIVGFDAIFSQAVGAEDEDAFGVGLRRAFVFSLLISIPLMVVVYCFPPVLTWLEQPEDVIPIASDYMRVVFFGTPGFMVFVAVRHALQAKELLRPIVATILFANVVNAGLDYCLIFGEFGFPRLEAVGSAWATAFSRILIAVTLVCVSWRHLSPYLTDWGGRAFELKPLARMGVLGAPVGLQFILEMGAFSLAGIWAGMVAREQGSDAVLAGHQVSLKLASMTFMVPLGISIAASVRCGHAVGRGDQEGVRRSVKVALAMGTGMMALFGLAFMWAPGYFSSLLNKDAAVLAVAVTLVPIAGIFQIFDGVQVVSNGILRGLADTFVPSVLQLIGFWGIGVPASYYLCFELEMGAPGLWWGLVCGLAAVSVILAGRVVQQMRQDQERYLVDDRP